MDCSVCGNKTTTALLDVKTMYKDGKNIRIGVYCDICKECGNKGEPYEKEIVETKR